jgi:hypothetical protein
MSNPNIRIIANNNIDRFKWDQCVQSAINSRIYASSSYLDIVAPGWSGLIWGNYEYVMPLIVKRKFGISFLMQPTFAQQHGIFPEISIEKQTFILNYLREQFKYIAIHLNSSHKLPPPKGFEVVPRKNLILKLNPDYNNISTRFSKHARRQISKAENQKLRIVTGLQARDYIGLKNLAIHNKLREKSVETLHQLIEYGYQTGLGTIYAAYNEANVLYSAAFFLNDGKRVTYLNAASSPEGKQNRSMYLILNTFIREHSGTPLILDFEGSSIPGIARFYEGFGAENEPFFYLKMNRLPIPLRWIKR